MNIIPFVVSILLIFAISTNTLLKKRVTDDNFTKSVSGYMSASRKLLNESEKYYFDSIVEKKCDKPKKQKKQQEELESKKRKINIQNAKINIYPLITEKKENHQDLYNLITSLIRTLYKEKEFYYPNFEKNILNNIITAFEKGLKKDPDITLSNLFLEDALKQKIYYKMLKGTKFYDFNKKIGTASFLDFIKFEKINTKIPIKDASYELLITIFNPNISQEIQTLQQENPPKNLSRENIINICQKNSFKLDEKILELFDFSNFIFNTKDKTVVGIDKSTDIKIKRNISL